MDTAMYPVLVDGAGGRPAFPRNRSCGRCEFDRDSEVVVVSLGAGEEVVVVAEIVDRGTAMDAEGEMIGLRPLAATIKAWFVD